MFCLVNVSKTNLQPAYKLVLKFTPLGFNDFTHYKAVV